MKQPPEHTIAAGLRALELAALRLLQQSDHEVEKSARKGRKPHMEALIKAERAQYLYHQGRAAAIAVRALGGLPAKLRREAATMRGAPGLNEAKSSVADALESVAREIAGYFGERT